jgi:hypothetical protein
MATCLPPTDQELAGLENLAKLASPGPWASTTGCGASVIVGFVAKDEPGHTALAKGGFTLLEIDPEVYSRDGEPDDEELTDLAEADARFIAAMNPMNTLRLITALRQARAELAELRAASDEVAERSQ